MDESERQNFDSYSTLEQAVKKCEEITIRSISDLYEEGIDANGLIAKWSMFGEDPFIQTEEGGVPFSARTFVTEELCNKIINEKIRSV